MQTVIDGHGKIDDFRGAVKLIHRAAYGNQVAPLKLRHQLSASKDVDPPAAGVLHIGVRPGVGGNAGTQGHDALNGHLCTQVGADIVLDVGDGQGFHHADHGENGNGRQPAAGYGGAYFKGGVFGFIGCLKVGDLNGSGLRIGQLRAAEEKGVAANAQGGRSQPVAGIGDIGGRAAETPGSGDDQRRLFQNIVRVARQGKGQGDGAVGIEGGGIDRGAAAAVAGHFAKAARRGADRRKGLCPIFTGFIMSA